MFGTTSAPSAFSTSKPTAPKTAPGNSERHGTFVFGSTRNAHIHSAKLTRTLTTSAAGFSGLGSQRTSVVAAAPPTKTIAAPASHTTPTALSLTPRASTCHTWLKTNCNAATSPSADQNNPSSPTIDVASRLVSAAATASRTADAASPVKPSSLMMRPAGSTDPFAATKPTTAIATSINGNSDKNAWNANDAASGLPLSSP